MSFAATLIDDTNKDVFLGALSEESIQDCDIFIGIYEEETDTACGVMALSVMPDREEDDDRFALSVREIVIAEDYRSDESEEVLFRYLQELAALYECSSVFVPEFVPEDSLENRESFFSGLGFYEEEKKINLYKIKVADVKAAKAGLEYGCLNIADLSDEQWDQFVTEASGYSFDILSRDYYDPRTSIFVTDDDGKIKAGLLTSMRDEKLYIEGIAPFGGDEESLVRDLIFWEKDALKKHYRKGDAVFLYMITDRFYNRILSDVTDGKAEKTGTLIGFSYDVPVI